MASKVKSVFVCSECGWESSKWVGKCQGCGQWNTMQEELKNTAKPTASFGYTSKAEKEIVELKALCNQLANTVHELQHKLNEEH